MEDHARVLAPRAAEVVRPGLDGVAIRCFDGGGVDDEVVGGVFGVAAAGGDVALVGFEEFDVDAVEPRGGFLAENEVSTVYSEFCSTFYAW